MLHRILDACSKALLFAAMLTVLPANAASQYPNQTIKLVVGFPPGGGGDLYGRLIAESISKSLGTSVVVENKPGAGGNIAAADVAKSRPDGYTLLLAMSGNIAVAPVVRKDLPYKAPDDFELIGAAVEAPHGLFVGKNSRFKTAREFFDYAEKNEVTVGSTSPGGAAHMGLEMLKLKTKANILYVPYRGSGPAITDLMGGQTEAFFATAPPLVGQTRNGALRLLALTGEERNPSLPDVPTFKELGIPVVVTQWYGLAAPKGTPKAIVDTLAQHLSKALADPKTIKIIRQDGALEKDLSTDAFTAYVKQDIEGYRNNIDPAALKSLSH
ncbi:tripartite-type tricarboxylate transporter receptor subunit TctC [Advenella incenata]|uniref:Tripartite-type tricarboxylate transporter receptor subunit TctC n=1 Tax=Advenella incenata TaxID=267800 RepID=A0A4Q7VQX0_9BURK|nr:tripartite tricarboxylate transporter substrate binding protein [Advenella incenata]RZT98637.1 tripartite-type tricarboxylate transporter receptor subunit TctC [Advenella incenata]